MRDGKGHPSFSRPPPLRGWVASGARRKGESIFFLPTPTQGMGGERSETERGISAMVNDGGCPFMFDGTLSFDRVLMPASQASTAWSDPLPPLRGPPPPCKRGEARFEVETRSPALTSRGRQGCGLIAPLLHVFLAHPPLRGWVASGARRKGAAGF